MDYYDAYSVLHALLEEGMTVLTKDVDTSVKGEEQKLQQERKCYLEKLEGMSDYFEKVQELIVILYEENESEKAGELNSFCSQIKDTAEDIAEEI